MQVHSTSQIPEITPPELQLSTAGKVSIGLTRIDRMGPDELNWLVTKSLHERQTCFIVTPNVDHVVLLEADAEFVSAYGKATLQLADGVPLVWLSRLLGQPIPTRLAGADLMPQLTALAAREHARVAIVGGAPEVTLAASEKLRQDFGVEVAHISPVWGFEQDPQAAADVLSWIKETDPNLVFICLGTPRSEIFVASNLSIFEGRVVASVGAAVDFVAGTKRRAPQLLQRLGLEWLFRLVSEPRRLWARYLYRDLGVLPIAWRQFIQRRNQLREPNRGASIFVSWDDHNRRTESLAQALGIDVCFQEVGPKLNPRTAPMRYLRQAVLFRKMIRERRPRFVFVMLPPFPLLALAVMYAWRGKYFLVPDLHSGVFYDPKWRPFLPMTQWLLRRTRLTVVTNGHLKDRLASVGVHAEVVLDPVPVVRYAQDDVGSPPEMRTPAVLAPVSYTSDEPIGELIAAFRMMPERHLYLTGSPPPNVVSLAAGIPNVFFLGFLPEEKYWGALREADIVVALTTQPATVQCAAFEAATVGTPVVLSNTPVLRALFGDAATYANDHSPNALAEAINHSFSCRVDKQREIKSFFEQWASMSSKQLSILRELIGHDAVEPGHL